MWLRRRSRRPSASTGVADSGDGERGSLRDADHGASSTCVGGTCVGGFGVCSSARRARSARERTCRARKESRMPLPVTAVTAPNSLMLLIDVVLAGMPGSRNRRCPRCPLCPRGRPLGTDATACAPPGAPQGAEPGLPGPGRRDLSRLGRQHPGLRRSLLRLLVGIGFRGVCPAPQARWGGDLAGGMDTFLFQDFGSVLSFKLIEQSDRIRLMELTSSKRTREGQRCRLSLEVVRGLGEPVTALGTSPAACRGLCTNSSPLGERIECSTTSPGT